MENYTSKSIYKAKPPRIIFFDVLETVAIFFVISLHYSYLSDSSISSVGWFIYRTCIPIFFMINGALLLSKDRTLKWVIKRIAWIFIQIEIWNLIYLLISIINGSVAISQLSLGMVFNLFFEVGRPLDQFNGSIANYHLWFSYALVGVYLLYPLLNLAKKHSPKLLNYVAIVAFAFSVGRLTVSVYGTAIGQALFGASITLDTLMASLNPFSSYAIYVFYFCFGWIVYQWILKRSCISFCGQNSNQMARSQTLIKNPENKCTKTANKITFAIAATALFVLGISEVCLECILELSTLSDFKTLSNEYSRVGTMMASLGLFIGFSLISFPSSDSIFGKIVGFISKNTLGIYYIHMIFVCLFAPVIESFGGTNLVTNSVRALVVLLISLVVSALLNKIIYLKKLVS